MQKINALLKNKTLVLVIVVGVLVALVISIFSVQQTAINPEPTPTPYLPPFDAPTGATIQIGGEEVKNFYSEDRFTYPNGNAVLEETGDYQLAYFADRQLFIVSVYPPQNAFAEAEQALLSRLNIDQDTACSLNVSVRVYVSRNLDDVPVEQNLSFCN